MSREVDQGREDTAEANVATASRVEQVALAQGPFAELCYPPTEQIGVVVVGNFPALGKLAAMRFLEWVQDHPEGVISLPTGKTPEHFIHWVRHLLGTWQTPATQAVLSEAGVDPARRPDMRSLRFVQIDEFYPIDPLQHNSFCHYVRRLYLEGFGLDARRAMLIDCTQVGLEKGQTLSSVWPDSRVDLSLRTRQARTEQEKTQQTVLRRIDQWCQEYEERIRALGGIGFFLGGIGPDGHIGFNIRGSDHFSTTRLLATNYETQAAAASDLGGMEVSRNRLVITIGLGTITYNPDCAAIIMAAGETKSHLVADAVQGPKSVLIAASALRGLSNARFYLTRGAARDLRERQRSLAAAAGESDEQQVDRAIVDLAVTRNRRILDLLEEDLRSAPFASRVLQEHRLTLSEATRAVHDRLVAKIEAGCHPQRNRRFLHTEPHHDDLMLGCLPYIVRNIREITNRHHFATFTSGFTAVTNAYMLAALKNLEQFLVTTNFAQLHASDYFDPASTEGRNRDVWLYLDGVAGSREEMRSEGAARRLLRSLVEVYEERSLRSIADRVAELKHYFGTVYPGKKDIDVVQRLKGMCREWEAECLWAYFGWQASHIHHLRLGFYTGEMFTGSPTLQRDVPPIVDLLRRTAPDVVAVALDPEASGPDTHYKVLQAVNEAVHHYAAETERQDLRLIGYRNVWHRFHAAEANVYVPVSLNMFSVMNSAFLATFVSQREASFPSHEHDGPFCELAQRIQVEQYQTLKVCLGRQWFAEHPSPLIRATRGFVFLREMDLEEFAQMASRLRQATEQSNGGTE
jgi:glucosamine-6-phosphate deaminase